MMTDSMRILHFSTDDIKGGAAKAAYRLHATLCDTGHQSQMIVRQKSSDDDRVWQAPPARLCPWASRFDRLRQRMPGLRRTLHAASYTYNFDPPSRVNLPALFANKTIKPDVICLHWITGLLDVRSIRQIYDHYRKPMVWVMADQEPMTGGCHYSFGCANFVAKCGNCPQLRWPMENDQSKILWQRKKRYLSDLPICFVAPTSWGMARLKQSSLFCHHRVELIPYPIDDKTFRPFDKKTARDLLHLPQDKKIIFFGATYLEDRRKGMKVLIEAFASLAEQLSNHLVLKREDVYLLAAGLNGKQLIGSLPFAGKYAGHFNDDLTLALAYQAADIFVCPSVEDAGPMMIPEAMMCGTPVVAFNAGGAPDLIETMKTGYLADLAEPESLARGILALLETDNENAIGAEANRKTVERHRPELVAERYMRLFRSASDSLTL